LHGFVVVSHVSKIARRGAPGLRDACLFIPVIKQPLFVNVAKVNP